MSVESSSNATLLVVHPLKVQRLFFKNYCYLVYDARSKDTVLVDPAWEWRTITETLRGLGCIPKAVLLTHHHLDHVHLASDCAKYYQIPVLMSAEERDYYHFSCTNLESLPNSEQFSIGTIPIRWLITPGHTKGSICYVIGEHWFTGDTLFNEGCGICVGKGACPKHMYHSLQALKERIKNTDRIYPGHLFNSTLGVGQTFATVKANNIYLGLASLEDFVAFRMRTQSWQRTLAFQ